MERLSNVGSAMGKDIINLLDGSFVGTVQGSIVDTSAKKIVGLRMRQKGILGNKNVLAFGNVRAIGEHVVTVSGLEGSAEGKEIIGMSVITADGTFMGKIVDFAFDEYGAITEFILKDGVMKGLPNNRGAVDSADILTIGKDMVIAKSGIAGGEFSISDEEIYGNWEEVDGILDDLEGEGGKSEATEEKKEENKTEKMTDKINKSLNEVGNKIKEIDTDKIKAQSAKLGNEAKGLWDSLKDKVKGTTKEEAAEAVDAAAVAEELKGKTVEKPLLDDEGNVLVWPAQVIDQTMVEEVAKAGKVEELKAAAVTPQAEAEEKTEAPEEEKSAE